MIVGGCFMNMEMAYSLLLKGKKVILSSRRGTGRMGLMELGDDNSSPGQQRLNILMAQHRDRLTMLFGKNLKEITEDGAVLEDIKTK